MTAQMESGSRRDTRARIVAEASRLLREQGRAAVTTRGVAEAARVQAPTIYRLFGDKDGLLDAVAEHVMATFVAAKASTVAAARVDDVDPVDDLREGWRTHLDFGLANPALFVLLNDPERRQLSPAAQAGRRVLASRIRRLAEAGRLRVSEERAAGLVHAAGTGAVLTLLATPPDHRDLGLADDLWAAVQGQILTDPPEAGSDDALAPVVAVRAVADRLSSLSTAERALLADWLDRVLESGQPPG